MQLVGGAVFYNVCKWFFFLLCNTNPVEMLELMFWATQFSGSVASFQIRCLALKRLIYKKNSFCLNRFNVSVFWIWLLNEPFLVHGVHSQDALYIPICFCFVSTQLHVHFWLFQVVDEVAFNAETCPWLSECSLIETSSFFCTSN